MICPECGTRLPKGKIECHFCGDTQIMKLPETPLSGEQDNNKEQTFYIRGIIGGLIVGFLTNFIVSLYFIIIEIQNFNPIVIYIAFIIALIFLVVTIAALYRRNTICNNKTFYKF